MERESFESEKIGKLLNENFVSIKVDREERPDVDRVYMTFIQVRPISSPLTAYLRRPSRSLLYATCEYPHHLQMHYFCLDILYWCAVSGTVFTSLDYDVVENFHAMFQLSGSLHEGISP